MKFHYPAIQKNGKRVEGDYEAESAAEVLTYLAGKDLKPLSIKKTAGVFAEKRKSYKGGINVTDQIFLTKYLSLMLRVGANLLNVIDILIVDVDKPALKPFLTEVRDSLQKGQSFHSVFARYPNQFSTVFVSMVRAGEVSGNLDSVLERLSITLDRQREFRSRVVSALVYPAFLMVVATLILFFLVAFALPRIAEVFSGSGFTPPLFSRVVFAVGFFLSKYAIPIGILVLGTVAFLWYFIRFTSAGKAFLSRLISLVPVVRSLYHKISIQRFTSTLSALMKAGLPILESLHVTADVLTYPDMRNALYRVADEGVSKGLSLGTSFPKQTIFPQVLTNLIAISEKAGHIDEILNTLSQFYETEVDVTMKRVIAFVEPMMLLLIGGVVGLVALAIILPIYQLVSQF